MKYKRYMVFEWDEYDNVAPFDCVKSTHSNKEEAVSEFNTVRRRSYGCCVFDRVEGVIIIEQGDYGI